MRFLAVEVTGADSPVTRLSKALPAVALDVFLKVPQPGEEPAARAVCQARGGTPEEREAMLEAIRGVDPDAVRMESPPGALWSSARFPLDRATREMQAVARFAAANGLWAVWCMVTDGVMFLRLMADGRPATMADDLRRHLAGAGIDAQTELEELNDRQTQDNVRALALLLERFRQTPSGRRSEGF